MPDQQDLLLAGLRLDRWKSEATVDLHDPLTRQREWAIKVMDTHLRDVYAGQPLAKDQLKPYLPRRALQGWRCTAGTHEVDLVVGPDFPYARPEIFLPGRSRALEWPHVGSNNDLCVLSEQDTSNPDDPIGVADQLLVEATSLIDHLSAGQLQDDFMDEFLSYWALDLRPDRRDFVLLFEPPRTSREIAWWSSNRLAYVADTAEAGTQWLERYHGTNKQRTQDRFRQGLFLWLSDPLHPPYPHIAADLYCLAKSVGAENRLSELIQQSPDVLPVIVGFEVQNGLALGGVWIKPPSASSGPGRRRDSVTDGFRTNRVPEAQLVSRYMSGRPLDRVHVQRADPTWIHRRGGTELAESLSTKHVTFIGCGSVGAGAAELLAQAGVHRFTLIDDDILSWDNVGRHRLGGSDAIGAPKATALKREIQRRLPHIDVTVYPTRWQRVWEKTPAVLLETDCIVAAIGHWPSEAALNHLARSLASFPDLVFSWVEPHAAAAHTLAIRDAGGCLMCGMTATGRFLDQAIEWSGDDPLIRLPACGGHYQPYGPVDLAPAHHLTAATVLDLLNGRVHRSQHRVWFGDRARIERLGGHWASTWIAPSCHPGDGLRVIQRSWPVRCGYCK